MPGPFDSDKTKGTFEKDISCIKQNDVWSSATFNNFVKSFYNRYCSDSNFERVFADNERQRIVLDNTSNTCSGDTDNPYSGTQHSVNIADALFHVNKAKKRVECYLVSRDTDLDAFEYDEESDSLIIDEGTLALDRNAEPRMRLFCGRGDVSLHVPPYALFPVVPAEIPGGETPGESRTVYSPEHDAYFCVTYVEGDVHTNSSPDNAVTEHDVPRYATTCELVFIFDPSIPHGNHVISRVDGNAIREVGESTAVEDVTTKLTLIFGSSATIEDLCNYLNNLTCNGYSKYKAEIVGNYRGSQTIFDALTWNVATLASSTDLATSFTKVIRFIPIKPCISFADSGSDQRFLSALTAPDGEGEGSLVESITKYEYLPITAQTGDPDPEQPAKAVFVHTGTYGFILSHRTEGNEIGMPAMTAAGDLQLIYIPDKSNTSHYVPAEALENNLPEWYKTLPGGINRAVTKDYNSEFFFIPFITVTERTIEIADFILDIDTILDLGDIITPILPGPYQPKLLESNVTYDAWWANQRSKKLYKAADQIYRKYRKGLYGVYEKTEEDNFRELRDLDVKRPKPNSLVRTLQMMTGLTWQLNNIVWIDPMLGADNNSGDDMSAPALKMFSGYDKLFEYEDTYSGPGSILTPNTTVIYLDDGSVFPFSLAVNNIDRLPSGLKHICFTFDDPDERLKVTDTDFTLDGATLYNLDLVISRDLDGTSVDPDDYHTVYFTNQDFSLIPRLYLCRPDVQLRPIPRLSFSGGKYRSLACDVGVADTVVLEKHVELSPTEAEASIYGSEICAAFLCLDDCGDVKCSYEPSPAYWRTEYGYDPRYLFLLRNINASAIDLRLVFKDIVTAPGYIRYKDMRNKSLLRSVVGVDGEVKNSRITFTIVDKKNMQHSWVAPDGETTYPLGTWQAFDPDIFLPNADENDSTFPDAFMFIDCGLFSKTGQGRLVNCELNIDLSKDFTRREPLYTVEDATQGNKRVFRCRDDSQFFASRMFRKSPYIFYFGDRHPYYYGASSELTAYDYSVLQSEKVDFKIFFSQPVDRMAVRYDITESPVVSPSIPSIGIENEAYMLTKQACRSFISGLKDSSISLPTMFMPAVAKSSFTMASGDSRLQEYLTYQHNRYAGGFAVSLLECVTGCTINLGILDTTFPLQDEWKYSGIDYSGSDTRIYWAEPAYGFQFFTYPRNMEPGEGTNSKYPDMIINRNNHLYVAEWITRQTISGIYGLYDSEVRINYSFTTQRRNLNLAENERADDMTSGLLGPIRWDLSFADPGTLHHKQDFIPNGKYNANFYYLPATPLFYLAEVCSCDVHLELSTKNGWRGTSPLGGTRINPNDIRSQYYNNPIPNFEPSSEDKRRSLRLAVGYVLWLGGYWPVLAPSSYNTITAHITRANLIAGMMNKVSGWCYRLVSTRSKSFTPERYHSSDTWDHTDILDPQGPLLGNLVETELQPENNARPARYFDGQAILDPDNRSASLTGTTANYLGTLKPSVVTKELAFDCTAAGRSLFEPVFILTALSFLHADYPVLGTSLLHWSDTVNTTMNNTNAVAYAPSCEWGHSGYTIMFPGYKGSIDSNNVRTGVVACPTEGTAENAVKGYAGRIPEPSKLVLGDGESGASLYTWTQEPTNKFDQKTPMINALNVAELDVLQVATDDIYYINPLRVTRAGESDPTVLFDDRLGNLKVKQGQLLHTVIAQGWWFIKPDPVQH